MPPIDLVKNELLLSLDATLIRTSHCDEDMLKCKYNSIASGIGMRNKIKDLAKMQR